jgi:general secretion pathway protein A
MYERFFNFRERPFDLTPNPRFLVMTEAHREALSNLEYAIASRKGITLLLGEAGCGKTTVIRAAIDRQPSRVHCVHVTNPALTRQEFVETLAVHFNLGEAARLSKATLLRELEALLRRRREMDETTVLVIDEAQSLSNELLEELRLLANIETADDKLLSLILAGQPELADQLNQESLRQLKQRVALRCELRPLTIAETLSYLAGRVRAAGGVGSRVFTREAATLIHEYAGGIPRLVNVLADNALLAAFARQSPHVTSQIVHEIGRDFYLSREPKAADTAPAPTPTETQGTVAGSEPAESPAPSLLSIVAADREAPNPIIDAAPAEPDAPLLETFSAKRRFPFLGRRGTA